MLNISHADKTKIRRNKHTKQPQIEERKKCKTVTLRIILTETVVFVNRIINPGNLTRLILNQYTTISTKQRMRERKRNV